MLLLVVVALTSGCQKDQQQDPTARLSMAEQQWKQGDADGARNILQQLLTDYPRLSPARTLLGRIELAQGHLDRAEHHLQHDLGCVDDGDQARLAYAELLRARGDMQKLSPLLAVDLLSPSARDSARHQFLLGEAATGMGDRVRALGHYQRALQIDPQMNDAQLGLVRSLIQQGNDPAALQQITVLLQSPTAPAELFELRAGIEIRQGLLDAAINSLDQAIALAPNRQEARIGRARLLLRLQHTDTARREIDSLLQKAPDSIAVRLLDADLVEQLGDRDGTISRLREIFLLDPSASSALKRLGSLLYQRQRWKEAELYLDRYLTLPNGGDEIEVRQMLARSQLKNRNFISAEKNLSWLRSHGGGDVAELDLTELYLFWGKLAEGLQLADELARRLPQRDAALATRLGELLLQQDQPERALVLLTRITSNQQESPPQTRLLLIRTLIATSAINRAEREAGSWREAAPDSALAWQASGEVAAANGHWPEAETAWQQARAIDDSDPKLWIDIATATRQQNRPEEGRKLLGEALVRFPDQLELQLAAANFERKTGHLEGYHAQMKQLIEQRSEEALPRIQYAQALLELGQAEVAQQWLAPLNSHEQSNADYQLIAGEVALALKDANSAVLHCKRLSQLRPTIAAYHQLLGRAYLLQKAPLSAVSAFAEAWHLEPGNSRAFSAMIDTQIKLQKYPDAEHAIIQAIKDHSELDPQTVAVATSTLVEAQIEAGQLEDAERLLEQAKKLTSTTPSLLALKIDLLILKQQSTEAERLLSQLRQIEQNGAYSHFIYARLLQRQGKKEQASAELQQSLAITPLPRAHLALLDLLLERKEYSAAEAQANTWQKQHPEDLGNLQRLAKLYQQSGKIDQAIARYEELLKLAPNQIDAMVNLVHLIEPRDPGLALGYAKQAYLLTPSSPELSALYGWLLLRTKQSPEQAQRLLQSAHDSHPHDLEIRYHLAQAELALDHRAEAIKHLRILTQSENSPYQGEARALLDSLAWRPQPGEQPKVTPARP